MGTGLVCQVPARTLWTPKLVLVVLTKHFFTIWIGGSSPTPGILRLFYDCIRTVANNVPLFATCSKYQLLLDIAPLTLFNQLTISWRSKGEECRSSMCLLTDFSLQIAETKTSLKRGTELDWITSNSLVSGPR